MPSPDALTIRDYAAYLVGNRQAILRIATSKGAVFIGALFVLSAGFAREYDGADLRAEPWHLAIPFGASIATSFVLFCAVWLAGRKRRAEPMPFWKAYRGFLSLYWATAPLAWLYAIPVERMLPVLDAIRANYGLLLIVSIWRIVLITRAIAVTNSCSTGSALSISVLIALIIAFVAEVVSPTPVAHFMSGIRVPPDERLASNLAELTTCISMPASIVALIAAFLFVKRDNPWHIPRDEASPLRVSWALRFTAIGAVVIWIPVMSEAQIEQRNRREVERFVEENRFDEAIHLLCTHARADYPPCWRPPPRIAQDNRKYDTFMLFAEALRQDAPTWVCDSYRNATMAFISPGVPVFDAASPQFEALTYLIENDDAVRQALSWLVKRQFPSSQPGNRDQVAKAIIAEVRSMSSNR